MDSCAHIQTGVDRLLHLINEQRELTVTEAANMLRVDRAIIEVWSQTLENSGLITAKHTLTDTLLSSRDHERATTIRKMLKHMKLTRTAVYNEHDLKAKSEECQRMLKEVKEHLAEAKRYESCKAEQDKRAHDLQVKESQLAAFQKRLDKDYFSLQDAQKKHASQLAQLAVKEAASQAREQTLARREQELLQREKQLLTHEKALARREAALTKTVGRLVKLARA